MSKPSDSSLVILGFFGFLLYLIVPILLLLLAVWIGDKLLFG